MNSKSERMLTKEEALAPWSIVKILEQKSPQAEKKIPWDEITEEDILRKRTTDQRHELIGKYREKLSIREELLVQNLLHRLPKHLQTSKVLADSKLIRASIANGGMENRELEIFRPFITKKLLLEKKAYSEPSLFHVLTLDADLKHKTYQRLLPKKLQLELFERFRDQIRKYNFCHKEGEEMIQDLQKERDKLRKQGPELEI